MGILTDAIRGRRGLLSGDGPAEGDPAPFAADVTPPARSAAPIATADRAVTLVAVYRGAQILAGMCAQLSIEAVRGGVTITPTPSLLVQPDPWRELSSWIERIVIDLVFDGNAFLRKHKMADGATVASLEVLNPFAVTVGRRPRTGVKFYAYTDLQGVHHELTSDEVIHLWNLEFPGRDRGLGPIAACRETLAGQLDTRGYAAGWFRQSDIPSGVLTSDQPIDKATREATKEAWTEPGEYGVRVLGKGLHYESMLLNPEDAQWLQVRGFDVTDVARLLGIPAAYLLAAVEGSSLTYQNLQQVDRQLVRTTLLPVYLRKIEAALTSVLVRGQSARFNVAEFLRPDAKERAEVQAIYLDKGVLSEQEVREAEGYAGRAPGRPAVPAAPVQPIKPAEVPAE